MIPTKIDAEQTVTVHNSVFAMMMLNAQFRRRCNYLVDTTLQRNVQIAVNENVVEYSARADNYVFGRKFAKYDCISDPDTTIQRRIYNVKNCAIIQCRKTASHN